jgi:uncharacterized membrane protein YkoI
MMFGNKILVGVLLAGLIGCSTASPHIEPYRDVSCFRQATVPLLDAILAAESFRGERAIDGEYNITREMACLTGDPGHYDIMFFHDGELRRATVDAKTGAVGPGHEESVFRKLIRLDFLSDWSRSEMIAGGQAAAEANITLRAAIAIAEERDGRAMAAHVTSVDGETHYVVEIVGPSGLQLVEVDSETGLIRE